MQASFQPLDPGLIQALRFNEAGLIPAVAQDWLDGAVLMVAWMNREAIEHTLATGEVHYWSRSRQELWHKGATSGHTQRLRGLRYDCDADVLLLTIEQSGDVACHTGARSCFYDQGPTPSAGGPSAMAPPADVCTEVMRVIEGRRDQPDGRSPQHPGKCTKGGKLRRNGRINGNAEGHRGGQCNQHRGEAAPEVSRYPERSRQCPHFLLPS